MFLAYPEGLSRTLGEKEREQLAIVINFRVFGEIFPREMYYLCWGWFDKYYLWQKSEVGTLELGHEISNNVVCATSKASDQPAHTRSLIRAFSSRLIIL